jgi:hypothetical protein
MTSQYRHRRTSNPATAFPNPLEPGEISVNTANRQLAVGDAAAGTTGSPLPLLAVRYFDARAQYAVGAYVINAGVLYRAKVAVTPAVFTASQWDMIAGAVDPQYVEVAGDVMTGPLSLPAAAPTAGVHATNKTYVDALVAAKSSVLVSPTKPTPDPIDSTLWYDSVGGQLYIRYNDGNTVQWVIASPQPDASQFDNRIAARAVLYDSAQTLTDAQKTQARKNIYAAPVDALSYSGLQVNGAFEVSQEHGDTAIGSGYPCDNFFVGYSGPTLSSQRLSMPHFFPNHNCALYIQPTVAYPTMSGSEFAIVQIFIEGYRFTRLGWGTSNALPLTIAFWSAHERPGIYSVAVRNPSAYNRTYAAAYTQAAGGLSQYNVITIPPDTVGPWDTTTLNGRAAEINFAIASGPVYTAPTANAWVGGDFVAAPGQVNAAADETGDRFRITGLLVLPGIEAPSAERSALIMRPFDQELLTCRRYLQINPWMTGHFMEVNASEAHFQLPFIPPMRSDPTILPRAYTSAISRAGVMGYDVAAVSLYANGEGALIIVTTAIPAVLNVPANLAPGTFMLDARL